MSKNGQEQLKRLESLIKLGSKEAISSTDFVTPDELSTWFAGIIESIKTLKDSNDQTVKTIISHVSKIDQMVNSETELTSKQRQNLEKEFLLLKRELSEKVEDIKRGVPKDFLKKSELPTFKAETPESIRNKLETLRKDERLDKKAIKGLEDILTQKELDRAISILDQRTQFLINKVQSVADSSLSSTSGQYKTFVTVGSSNADYITDGTADDVQIQAALNYVSGLGGGVVHIKEGTYNVIAKILIPSYVTMEGEGAEQTTILMGAGLNLSVIGNSDTTNGNDFIHVKDITIDQQGATQSAGGNSFTGLRDSTFSNVVFEKSRVFNLFIGSLVGTALTGTLSFTNGDSTVTGSSTLFTTELVPGSIIKSAGAHFQRVLSITSDTSLELDRAWGWATEAGVVSRIIPANARNKILNCNFNGTIGTSDNVGLGLFDDCLVQGCISRDSTGYGFGPDHANRAKFIGNTCYNNTNSGIGAETCGYCIFSENVCHGNGNGIYLLSGAYRNIVSNNHCFNNINGIKTQYNSTSFPFTDENKIIGNTCEYNQGNVTANGIRLDGVAFTLVEGNICANNQANGILQVVSVGRTPHDNAIKGNLCYDNQDTKVQAYGIQIADGLDTLVKGNFSLDQNHVNAGITDSGTNTYLEHAQSGTDPHYDGSVHIEGTTNPGIGWSLYTNHGASATAPLGWVRSDNVAYDRDVFVIDNDSTSTSSNTLRVTGGAGIATIIDANGTSTAGLIVRNVSAARTGVATAALLAVHQDASSGTGDSLGVTNDNTGTAVGIDQNGVLGSLKYALFVDSNGVQTTSDLVRFRMDNSSSTRDVLFIDNDGTGEAIFIDHDDTGTNASIDIDRDGNNAGTITGLKINVANAGAGAARGLWVEAGTAEFDGRVLQAQGADVASANDLTLGLDGNTFEITGTTQVNAITIANWQNGSLITLLFTSTPTVKHNTAGGAGTVPILLAGAADFVASAGDTLSLRLCEIGGTQAWREVGRAVI